MFTMVVLFTVTLGVLLVGSAVLEKKLGGKRTLMEQFCQVECKESK